MIDFLKVGVRDPKKKDDPKEVYPKFIIKKSSDLMIRGGDFYAVWVEDRGLWSTDEDDATQLIDRELDKYIEKHPELDCRAIRMEDADSGIIDKFHKYCQRQLRDNFHPLDEQLVFSNTDIDKRDYASKRLNYPLEKGSIKAFDKIMSSLYSKEERHKIEWAIGAIVSGDSKTIQKFVVLYGSAGTGKSTVLNIIQQLFDGYYSVFDAKALGSTNSQFALEAFSKNPLVAIQHDGDLSRIEDNTRLNSLVSHEIMRVNEKFKSTYENRFQSFLFIGTNKPVKITDGRSGLIRRLIDVSPTGKKIPMKEYLKLTSQIKFELGAIAYHCQEVYLANPAEYDDYIPINMLGASNDFYNFVIDSYSTFKKEDGVSLKSAWEMYKVYCDEAKVAFPLSKRSFGEELKNYFWEFKERYVLDDGGRIRNYYYGFREDKFVTGSEKIPEEKSVKLIQFEETGSVFDKTYSKCFAQYASSKETPTQKWDDVTTTLSELDTSKVHYVRVPTNHIVIDFDIKGEDGHKSLEKNIEAASKWPQTYAELSKSGAGVHLHYIYTGDPEKLSRVYDDNIEIKVFTGKSSLRRKLTKCTSALIATISSGLPLKGEKMIDSEVVKTEKGLRTTIKKCLNKEVHSGTKPNVDFIYKILEDAFASDLKYDVTDMRNAVFAFAANSTNQAEYCLKLVNTMQFKSVDPSAGIKSENDSLIFYDVEVFPNLFLVNWKLEGENKPVVRMINPSPAEIEDLVRFNLVGFNCRRYDNHIMYGRLIGYSNEELYKLSQRIINGERDAFFREAYNLSYTDVYDFASAGNKKSLKKFEIELGITHKELGLPWDQPVPEKRWVEVAEYCDNDVIATEATFNYLSADWTARQILADLSGKTVNDKTNTHTERIIFEDNKDPQDQFQYRNLAEPVLELENSVVEFLKDSCPVMMSQTHGADNSLLPYFPGYKYDAGKSTYKGIEVGEGGRVYAEPGIYERVALLDITSMHPHSTIAECLFGVKFTTRFKEIVDGRVDIKHEAWEDVNQILDGKLTKYIQKVIDGELTSGELADALKTAINSVYGLTSASFNNAFHDPRNKDNIVAKRGALFMVDLQFAVQEKGFVVAHIKTDSIKIPDATPEIINFVMTFGAKYGYAFEHEATYEKMCLVNDAVYIAKYASPEFCEEAYGYIPKKNNKKGGKWDATGTQFQVPYVFKKLFSKEDILFNDLCETKSVKSALYLDRNEQLSSIPEFEELKTVRLKMDTDSDFTPTKKQQILADKHKDISDEELDSLIAKGHDYQFIGKIGRFCPVRAGSGGGLLVREQNGKYYAATGTKGYRWVESELLSNNEDSHDIIDRSYYDKLVDDAVETISEYGDFEWFIS